MTDRTHLLNQPAYNLLFDLLVAHQNIERVHFLKYKDSPGLEERLPVPLQSHLAGVFTRARAARAHKTKSLEIPYWNAILAAALESDSFEVFLAEALRHTPGERARDISLHRSEINKSSLDDLMQGLGTDESLAVVSLCTMRNGTSLHLPMMDFRLPTCPENVARIVTITRYLGLKRAAIVASGRSYHAWGRELVPEPQLKEFLYQAMLLAPLTDSRYIAHRLLEDACVLRISHGAVRRSLPTIVELVDFDEA